MTSTRVLRHGISLLAALSLVACGASGEPAGPGREAPAVAEELNAMLPDEVRGSGVLVVGTDPSYPPASSFGPDGRTIIGFEPDLGAALGSLLGIEVEFRPVAFDTVLDDLAAGRIDVVMSAMTDTPERQQVADFVNYFRAGTSIVVQRGNPHGIHDLAGLCGQVVAVEAGTVQVGLLERSQAHCAGEDIVVVERPTNDDALLELRTGRVAAVLNDYPPAVFVTSDERTQASFQLVSDVQYEPGLYGIAVARDRTALRDALAASLARLVESGTYADILAEWKVTSGAVPAVTVNGRSA